jgi:hypothetical protein
MKIHTIKGTITICKECDNKAMNQFEYCCICACIEGLI